MVCVAIVLILALNLTNIDRLAFRFLVSFFESVQGVHQIDLLIRLRISRLRSLNISLGDAALLNDRDVVVSCLVHEAHLGLHQSISFLLNLDFSDAPLRSHLLDTRRCSSCSLARR